MSGGKLQGSLSLYPSSSTQNYPYFLAGPSSSSKCLVFVGGLTNGMLDPGYTVGLAEAIGQEGWKFAALHLSSSYAGYGISSLSQDVTEMEAAVKHLREVDGIQTIVLMGHSTGSQDVLHYLSSSTSPSPVQGGIMQAPASDREFAQSSSESELNTQRRQLAIAQKLVNENEGRKLLDRDEVGYIVTAERFVSLFGIGGNDDYFSEDIPLHPDQRYEHCLDSSFGKMSAPALALPSEDDVGVAKNWQALHRRWIDASHGKLEVQVVRGADHGVSDAEARKRLYGYVIDWLKRVVEH